MPADQGPPLLECGHAANATNSDGAPACAICIGIHPGAETVARVQIDLTGRQARCCDLSIVPSRFDLAFFEYRGEGSRVAREHCGNCSYMEAAHTDPIRSKNKHVCDNFVPHGAYEYDSYYCGHAGWD